MTPPLGIETATFQLIAQCPFSDKVLGLLMLPRLCPVSHRKYRTKHSPTLGNKEEFAMRRRSENMSVKCMRLNPIQLSLSSLSNPL